MPNGRWTFDAEVTEAFDDMLARSIPNYYDMRRLVTEAAVWHVARARSEGRSPLVVDLGCSRGAALQPVVDRLEDRASYVACDVSDPMLDACRTRFDRWRQAGVFDVRRHD